MSDFKYFVNCRGATFNKVHSNEWDESGQMPRLVSPFIPYTNTFNTNIMTFAGSTKTSNWLYYDDQEAEEQVQYLKDIGVNLIRIYGDMYCWATFKERYLNAVDSLSRICNNKKMYTQWVLFDGYTDGDTSSVNHSLGYFDPSTIYEAVSWGIKRWQRCPNINSNDLSQTYNYWKVHYGMPTRHPSSMVVSGDAYVTDMVNTAGKFFGALSWEIMHDVNILSTETSGYQFLVSAINKVNSIKSPRQKTTFSARNINASSAYVTGTTTPDIYNSSIVSSLTPLVDYVCNINSNFTCLGLINNYITLKDFSQKTGKPVMIIDSFVEHPGTSYDLFKFSKDFNIGVIAEGVVDRSLTRKPLNTKKGIIFDDGTCRSSKDVNAIKDKTISDGFVGIFSLSKSIVQKNSYSIIEGDTEYSGSSFDRFNYFHEQGINAWDTILNTVRQIPEYKDISIGYSPIDASSNSKSNGWGIVGDGSDYTVSGLFTELSSLSSTIYNTPLSAIGSEIDRDKACYKRIMKLIKLTEDLNMYKGHNYYNATNYVSSFISSSLQESLFIAASAFMPRSITKNSDYNESPFIGTPRYFSSLALIEGHLRDPSALLQKPICYWIRPSGGTIGCCIYNGGVTGTVSNSSNVISLLNWQSYDVKLRTWISALYNAYVNFNNNLRNYLINNLQESEVSNYLQSI
jgi:hypothetical protein